LFSLWNTNSVQPFARAMRYLKTMRNFLLPLLFFFELTSSAQQWPQSGAEWTYCYGPVFTWGFFGSEYCTYTRDTIVNGDFYNVLEDPFNPEGLYTTYLTRYSNDTVYRWVNNQEYLFFHFQMHLGEEILTYRSRAGSDDSLCNADLSLIVVDSNTVMVGTEELTRWKLRDTMLYNDGFVGYCDYWIYERIGFVSRYWLYSQEDWALCDGAILEAGYSNIGHYTDQTWTNHWQNCETSGFESEHSLQFVIFPNPTKNIINTSEEFMGYQLFSSDGKVVATENRVGNSIRVDDLLPGTYFITFLLQNDMKTRAVFLKE